MAKQIIWSRRAQTDRKEILAYWINRNKSNNYSKKLNGLIKEAIKLIADYPEIGKPTDDKNARIKIVRDYLIIYVELIVGEEFSKDRFSNPFSQGKYAKLKIKNKFCFKKTEKLRRKYDVFKFKTLENQ